MPLITQYTIGYVTYITINTNQEKKKYKLQIKNCNGFISIIHTYYDNNEQCNMEQLIAFAFNKKHFINCYKNNLYNNFENWRFNIDSNNKKYINEILNVFIKLNIPFSYKKLKINNKRRK